MVTALYAKNLILSKKLLKIFFSIWRIVGPKFDPENGQIMCIILSNSKEINGV